MTPELVMDIFADALFLVVLMLVVIVGPGLLVGLVVSMFQAATQINEQTLSFVPKLGTLVITLFIASPWMLSVLLDFTRTLFMNVPSWVG